MANTFKVKKLLGSSGIFSSIVTAPNLVYNTGDQTINGQKIFQGPIGIGESLYDFGFDSSIPTLALEDYGTTELRLGGDGTDQKKIISFYDSSIKDFEISHDVANDGEYVHFSGKNNIKVNFANNAIFQKDISVSGFYNFDITNTGEPVEGQMSWHPDYGTVEIGMNNDVINPVGFKSFYRVKAAENIRKGKVVMALGGVGNSEYILAREAQNIGNSGQLIMGVSAEEILANNYGDVVAFGAVRGVDTSSYPVDSILYFNTASTGEFTNILPQDPNPKIIVALNTTSNNNGIIFVRVGPDTSNFANLVHTHVVADVSGLGTAATRNVGTASNEVSPGNHTHVASDITNSTNAGRTLLTSNLAAQRSHLDFFPIFSGRSSFPVNGDVNRVYTALDTAKIYAWISLLNDYVEISPMQSGELDTRYALITNLENTGSTLSTNINTTGNTLSNKIDTLSGNAVLTNGEQTIFGTKYFSNAVYISDLYVTGTESIANVENKFVLNNQLYYSTDNRVTQLTGLSGNYDEGQFFGKVKLTQNNTRLINIGNTWVARDSSRAWFFVAMSSDGKYQTATVNGAQLYVSNDYGNTWVTRNSSRAWRGVAMSSDGKYQTVVVNADQIYISSDYGNTWVARDSSRNWNNVTMSSDGKYQTAVVSNGFVYTSSDYGNTWVARLADASRNWYGVAISSDGKYQTATAINNQIFISSNYGNTWTAVESAQNWRSVTMSSDGKYQTAVVANGLIYISNDYGNTWVARDSSRNWFGVAMSSDGKLQVATVTTSGQIYISSDFGNTWVAKETNRSWRGVAISSDGKYITAVVQNGQIYTSVANEYIEGDLVVNGNILAQNIVYTTGNQTISGIKTFTTVNESFLVLNITNQTINIPLNSGMNFILPLTTGVTGITFSNTPDNLFSFTLRVDYSGAHAIVWPTGSPGGILWPDSTPPTLTSITDKKDLFTFLTYNSGTEFFGVTSAQNY
jgi:hypothetical protein